MKGLIDYISERYTNVAEIGIGHYPDVAYKLISKGIKVVATDIYPYKYKGLKVYIDDITNPVESIYKGAGLIYSIRPAPEIVIYMKKLAEKIECDLIVKSLSSEFYDGSIIRYNGINFYIWKSL